MEGREGAAKKNRTSYYALWAWRVRQEVFAKLGRKCAICGTKKRLEIDHPNGRDYKLEKLNRWMRAVKLRAELARGELRILCRSCNAEEGGGRRYS